MKLEFLNEGHQLQWMSLVPVAGFHDNAMVLQIVTCVSIRCLFDFCQNLSMFFVAHIVDFRDCAMKAIATIYAAVFMSNYGNGTQNIVRRNGEIHTYCHLVATVLFHNLVFKSDKLMMECDQNLYITH